MLDGLAAKAEPLSFDKLFNLLQSELPTGDRERARELLVRLQRDHYIRQESDGRYRFTYPMIQRWWRLHRGL